MENRRLRNKIQRNKNMLFRHFQQDTLREGQEKPLKMQFFMHFGTYIIVRITTFHQTCTLIWNFLSQEILSLLDNKKNSSKLDFRPRNKL